MHLNFDLATGLGDPNWLGIENTQTTYLQMGETPSPTSVLDMALNNRMVKLQ